MGSRITFDGAGDGLGQTAGLAGGKVVAQLETAITHTSNNSSRDGLGRGTVFFMLSSDGGQCSSLPVFVCPGLVDLLDGCRRLGTLLAGRIRVRAAPGEG